MDDIEAILNVGSYCEQVLQNPTFQFLSARFEQQFADEWAASEPHENKKRDAAYFSIKAHREFLTYMATFVKAKNEALAKQDPPDHLDLIDDPNVHDIYSPTEEDLTTK